MSRIKRPDTSGKNSVYGPPADVGEDDAPTIARENFNTGSARRDGLDLGKTYSPVGKVYGPRFSGEDFTVSGGYNPKSNAFGGRYEEEGFSAGLGYDPRRKYVGGDLSLSFKKGGKAKPKKMAKGGKVSSASRRADGIAQKGKTKGRMV